MGRKIESPGQRPEKCYRKKNRALKGRNRTLVSPGRISRMPVREEGRRASRPSTATGVSPIRRTRDLGGGRQRADAPLKTGKPRHSVRAGSVGKILGWSGGHRADVLRVSVKYPGERQIAEERLVARRRLFHSRLSFAEIHISRVAFVFLRSHRLVAGSRGRAAFQSPKHGDRSVADPSDV